VLFRPLDPAAPARAPSGFVIRPGSAQDAPIVGEILTRSFHPNGDAPEGFADVLAPMFQIENVLTFLACVNENPVGAAAALIIPQFQILALFGAGTLPEFRGRGIQTMLLLERMKAAKHAGCEFAVVVTQGGSTSERNCLRQGFQVAYSKATVLKHVEQESPEQRPTEETS
jgi:ribosomal protein S18 acetylase RimI-like enzyme